MMELEEYKALCEKAGTGCNPAQLNEKPDELVRLKAELVKEFEDLNINCRYPSHLPVDIAFENGNLLGISLDYDPEGRIILWGTFPDPIYLDNNDNLIPAIRKIVEELAREKPR